MFTRSNEFPYYSKTKLDERERHHLSPNAQVLCKQVCGTQCDEVLQVFGEFKFDYRTGITITSLCNGFVQIK